MKVIETTRLILRTWKDEDIDAYYSINQDPKVIEFLRGPMTMAEVKHFITEMNNNFIKHNYTLWAVEEKTTGNMIGFIGLQAPYFQAHFTPCIEIGWRLGSQYWGKGYATEGAKAALDYGFNKISLKEIVSFTVPANVKSLRIMEKIGMRLDVNGNFAHPKLPANHHLSIHVLYRITNRKN